MKKILLKNGKIYSLDRDFNTYSTILIDSGSISYLGNEELNINDEVNVIDLNGRSVIPGFYDSHVHVLEVGKAKRTLDIHEVENKFKLMKLLEKKVEQVPAGKWIFGNGWKKDMWENGAFPSKVDIDPVSQENPVALYSKDMHTLLLNSKALDVLEIKKDTPFKGYGEIELDSEEQPTGILKEDACNLFTKKVTQIENLKQTLFDAFASFFEKGITSIDTMENSESCHDLFCMLERLNKEEELPLRINVFFPYSMLDNLIECGLTSGFGSEYLKIGGIKIFADGALGSQTAHLLNSYENDPLNFGISTISQEKLDEIVAIASRNYLKCAVHAIGDAAVNKAINSFIKSSELNLVKENNTQRFLNHRIEHMQLIQPDDIERLTKSGATASMQPIHISGDIDIAKKYWGERCRYSYLNKTLIDKGIPLIMGSDAPVEDMNPLMGIYAAVTRKCLNSRKNNSFYPEERLTLEEALDCYTVTPHVLNGDAHIKGSIMVGKRADIVILSDDLFNVPVEKIPEIRVEMTICNGNVVFER